MRPRISIRGSVRPSVGPSVGPSVTSSFFGLLAATNAVYTALFVDALGHVTTTELKNAFEWMNQNAFGGRGRRKVDYPYVNFILKQGKESVKLSMTTL